MIRYIPEADAAGITADELEAAGLGSFGTDGDGDRVFAIKWADAEKAREYIAAKTAPTRTESLATERQVNFIMSLIARGCRDGGWCDGPETREGVARMSKTSASMYIDSLLENR
ncbi:MAG: hypothetical protein HZY73_11425 [Micropruina sp.]|nr:MAG: hypothetical protein HZY73_11425 [Micropruina sp.]